MIIEIQVDLLSDAPWFNKNNVDSEVFVISQTYGGAYFYKNMENMLRLAPLFSFLRRHQHNRIHASIGDQTDALFRTLNLDPARIVSGELHADIVYLPRLTVCDQILETEGSCYQENTGIIL